jgi:hypothetical protein
MPGEFDEKHLKLWKPAIYCIQVEGVLDEIWADSLAGMRISTRKRADQSTVTTLTGRLRDQAELSRQESAAGKGHSGRLGQHPQHA